jgi:hypothetical protein
MRRRRRRRRRRRHQLLRFPTQGVMRLRKKTLARPRPGFKTLIALN